MRKQPIDGLPNQKEILSWYKSQTFDKDPGSLDGFLPKGKGIQFSYDLQNKAQNGEILLIDVRSPFEYSEDRILGAVNFPILNNRNKKIINSI